MPANSLTHEDLHLWFVRFDELRESDRWRDWMRLLDASELERAGRFVFERDRRTYVLAHALVRTMLSSFADVEPAAWRFESNAHGKPRIAEPAGHEWLRFNLSHTRGAALCGVVRNVELGVDIETLDRETDCVPLADRYFSAAETAALHRAPAELQRGMFFRFWTLKEAYIKARGLGLAIPLDQFSYELGAEERGLRPPTISFGHEIEDVSDRWQFAEVDCGAVYPAAIAVDRGGAGERRLLLRHIVELPMD